jgi:hypothetical protein
MVALRRRNLDCARRPITVDTGRLPRFGRIEAAPRHGDPDTDDAFGRILPGQAPDQAFVRAA